MSSSSDIQTVHTRTHTSVYTYVHVFLYVDRRSREIPVKQGAASKTSDAACCYLLMLFNLSNVYKNVFIHKRSSSLQLPLPYSGDHLNHGTARETQHVQHFQVWIGNVSDCRRIKNDSWSVLKHCDSRESL